MQLTKLTKILFAMALVLGITFLIFYMTPPEPELPPMTIQEKKARFSALVIPAVNTVYSDLMSRHQEISIILATGKSNSEIDKLRVEYKAMANSELLMALKPHPRSIAIAQAAMESSWATSRFFREANNIFGVWSFDEDEPRIAALQKRGDKTIWLKKYNSVESAVYDYYRTLARSSAFAEFRKTKMTTDDPFLLVKKLDRYSEKGSLYGEELAAIIRFNKFNDYDVN